MGPALAPLLAQMIQYEGHKGNVTAVGFQRDVKWFFTASEDSTAKLWDTRCAPGAAVRVASSTSV